MKGRKVGKSYKCKFCEAEYILSYNQQVCCTLDCQLKQNKKSRRKFVLKNKDKINSTMTLYYRRRKIEDPEFAKKSKEYSKNYREKNKERLREYDRIYHSNNKDKI